MVAAVIVGLGYLVPVTLLGLVGWVVFRRATRTRLEPAAEILALPLQRGTEAQVVQQ